MTPENRTTDSVSSCVPGMLLAAAFVLALFLALYFTAWVTKS